MKENKKRVAFWNCLKLDEHSLTAIELNAQINMMKFAHQHFSLFGDAQGIYVYPGKVSFGGVVMEFKISTGDEGGEGSNINVYMDRPRHGIKSDHVYLMYDQACSCYLNGRAKHQPRLKIKVALASQTLTSKYVPLQLRAFGISIINTTEYINFVQKIELGDRIPKVSILF
ncbi:unnamed protein product [Sphenostylis stenocarpa]|uniref:Uncharacterized protein n=1 Tax=Sphenostylis stenocarpa TaxID=92480 RepID=A0AA86SBQ8_9FABA|nr:unnamed protein product [Sphenostylis stenocarpa]